MNNYHSSYIRYERNGNTVNPVVVRKEWVGKSFTITRVSAATWLQLHKPTPADAWHVDAGGWSSITKLVPQNRASLMASGNLWEAGHGMPCLTINP